MDEKRKFATRVIDNSGSVAETEEQVKKLMTALKPSRLWAWVSWLALCFPATITYAVLTVMKALKC